GARGPHRREVLGVRRARDRGRDHHQRRPTVALRAPSSAAGGVGRVPELVLEPEPQVSVGGLLLRPLSALPSPSPQERTYGPCISLTVSGTSPSTSGSPTTRPGTRAVLERG